MSAVRSALPAIGNALCFSGRSRRNGKYSIGTGANARTFRLYLGIGQRVLSVLGFRILRLVVRLVVGKHMAELIGPDGIPVVAILRQHHHDRAALGNAAIGLIIQIALDARAVAKRLLSQQSDKLFQYFGEISQLGVVCVTAVLRC